MKPTDITTNKQFTFSKKSLHIEATKEWKRVDMPDNFRLLSVVGLAACVTGLALMFMYPPDVSLLDPHNALNIHNPMLHAFLVGVIFFLSVTCFIQCIVIGWENLKTLTVPDDSKKEKKTKDKSLSSLKKLHIDLFVITSVALSVQLYMFGMKTASYIFNFTPSNVCLNVVGNVVGNLFLVVVSFDIIPFIIKQLVKLVGHVSDLVGHVSGSLEHTLATATNLTNHKYATFHHNKENKEKNLKNNDDRAIEMPTLKQLSMAARDSAFD